MVDWPALKTQTSDLVQELEHAQRFYRTLGGLREGLVEQVTAIMDVLDNRQALCDEFDARVQEHERAFAAVQTRILAQTGALQQEAHDAEAHAAAVKAQTQAEVRELHAEREAKRKACREEEAQLEASVQQARQVHAQGMQELQGQWTNARAEKQADLAALEERIAQARTLLEQLTTLREGR